MKGRMIGGRNVGGRSIRLMLGLFAFALGVVLTIWADLGISPWDVLADGIRIHTPLTFGQAVIGIGAVLIVISLLFSVKPGPGTLANMIFIGLFADMLLAIDAGREIGDSNLAVRVGVLFAGIAVIGLGSALYIGAQMGAGPRDSMMVSLATRTPLSIRLSRTFLEGSALLIGALLGGSFGVGTAIFAVTIGPSVHFFFDIFGMDAHGRKEPVPPLEVAEGH